MPMCSHSPIDVRASSPQVVSIVVPPTKMPRAEPAQGDACGDFTKLRIGSLDYVLVHPFATKRAESCAEQGLRTGGPGGAPVYGTVRPHFHSCHASAVRPMEMTTPR